jgi:hypothetical protein
VGRDRFDQCSFGHFDLGDERLFDRSGFVAFGPEPERAFRAGVAFGSQ